MTSERVEEVQKVIVVDPGHGGADPGKVGINGVLEKDVNLQIAKKVKSKLEACGYDVRMTREEDEAAEGKLADMKKRVAMIAETEPDLVVSIHQNSYTDENVRGAQVFYYSESENGRKAAEEVQRELAAMDEKNDRQIKGNSDFYLLKKTKAVTIIVECGFLSNLEEAENLIVNEYQEEMAQAICAGITKWLD